VLHALLATPTSTYPSPNCPYWSVECSTWPICCGQPSRQNTPSVWQLPLAFSPLKTQSNFDVLSVKSFESCAVYKWQRCQLLSVTVFHCVCVCVFVCVTCQAPKCSLALKALFKFALGEMFGGCFCVLVAWLNFFRFFFRGHRRCLAFILAMKTVALDICIYVFGVWWSESIDGG